MSLSGILIISAGAALAYVTAIWIASVRLRNASIIDVFWGLGFILLTILYLLTSDGYQGRRILVAVLIMAWGLRLSVYLLWRSWGTAEDFRYREQREEAGSRFWWKSYFRVFLIQGFGLWTISMPILAALRASEPDHLTAFDLAGALVWSFGFLFEAVGDWQLVTFKANPTNEGRAMDSGLWRLTRHPNYFGDATLWWGYYLIAVGVGGGWITAFSPLLMTFVLMRVSGVASMDRHLMKTKPGYRAYVESTSAFFPWIPSRRT